MSEQRNIFIFIPIFGNCFDFFGTECMSEMLPKLNPPLGHLPICFIITEMRHIQSYARSLTDLFHNHGDETIVNEDSRALADNLGDVFVVKPDQILATFLHVRVVCCNLQRLTRHKTSLSCAALKCLR